ncbi:MAG: hypothetical protein O9318_09910 [Hylemonella sp.]|uniref:hypothetical protein n=1 Tax=Hylemonella sp. TaxID=2066020 RepID=UPI0022C74726|nr:hypothetical protein [Hylemonella sp.]MCZ8252772.1 hypothetical protein [Hylemonella sp.]
MKKSLIGLGLACAALGASAEAPRVRMYANVGYGFGGQPLIDGIWVNSSNQQTGTWDIKTGKGVVLALGADVRITERLSLQGSMGYETDSVEGVNGGYKFSRVPVELLGFYSVTERFRLGGGVRKVQSTNIQGHGDAEGDHFAYTQSGGAVLETQYFFSEPSRTGREPLFGMYLRYIRESYQLRDQQGDKKDGNHFALGLLFYY